MIEVDSTYGRIDPTDLPRINAMHDRLVERGVLISPESQAEYAERHPEFPIGHPEIDPPRTPEEEEAIARERIERINASLAAA